MPAGAAASQLSFSVGNTFPYLRFDRVTQGASVFTTPFNQMQTVCHMIGSYMYAAKQGVSTLATYIGRAIDANGNLAAQTHGALLGVTASQHHDRLHNLNHIGVKSYLALGVGTYITQMAVKGGVIVGFDYRGLGRYSTNGRDWSDAVNVTGGRRVRQLVSDGTYFFLVAGFSVYRSVDGVGWTLIHTFDYLTGTGAPNSFVTFGGNHYIVMNGTSWGGAGSVWKSTDDGDTWTYLTTVGGIGFVRDLIVFDSKLAFIGHEEGVNPDGHIYKSDDGEVWVQEDDDAFFDTAGDSRNPSGMGVVDGVLWVDLRDSNNYVKVTDWTTMTTITNSTGIILSSSGIMKLEGLYYTVGGTTTIKNGLYSSTDPTDPTLWKLKLDLWTTYDERSVLARLAAMGLIILGTAYHNYLIVVVPQDDITVNATQAGLLNTNMGKKIDRGVSGANATPYVIGSSFLGSSGATKYISLGFAAKYVNLIYQHSNLADQVSNIKIWELVEGMTYAIRHNVTNGLSHCGHTRPKTSEHITFGSQGITFMGSLNAQLNSYAYNAFGES